MKTERKFTIITENSIYYLTGFLLIFVLKLFYSRADSRSLDWILAPTARWVTVLTGIPFTGEPGAGYVNHSLRFIIAPSCCGLQFMIIVIALLIFSFTRHVNRKALWTFLAVCFSFPYTVLINGLRITLAIYIPLYFPGLTAYGSPLTPERLHTLVGTVVYFTALLALFPLASRAICGKQTIHRGPVRFLPPLFWYCFIVLGLPLMNRAYQKGREQFTEYMLLIICGCLAVLVLPILRFLLKSLLQRFSSLRADAVFGKFFKSTEI